MRVVRCLVTGRVQGVFFRARTVERAVALGLRGHVRNLPDGTVEVVAGGEGDAVEQLIDWLWHGPPLARVERVAVEVFGGELPADGFTVGSTPAAPARPPVG